MMEQLAHHNGGIPSARVSGMTSRAVVRLLSDRGVPANELVVTRAERQGNGEGGWVVTVLRGRTAATHEFSDALVGKVLAGGPCNEWYSEVGHLLRAAGVEFPA